MFLNQSNYLSILLNFSNSVQKEQNSVKETGSIKLRKHKKVNSMTLKPNIFFKNKMSKNSDTESEKNEIQKDTSQQPANTMNIENIIKQNEGQDRKDSFANPFFLQPKNPGENHIKSGKKKSVNSLNKKHTEPIIEMNSFGDNSNISFANKQSLSSITKDNTNVFKKKTQEGDDEDRLSQTSIKDFKEEKMSSRKPNYRKAYTLVYQKDIEISYLLLAKKELQIEQTLKKIEKIQQNEMKIPKYEKEIQSTRENISQLLEEQNDLKNKKQELTEDVVEIEQKDSVRATMLQPYREQFEDFKRKKSFFEKKNYKFKKEIIIYSVCVFIYIMLSYPVLKAIIGSSK
jgi:hypothetical protein